MPFLHKKIKVDVGGADDSAVFYANKIYNDKKENWIRKDAEEYAKIEIKYFKKHQRVLHKTKHFAVWATKLLVPDFLIGHPNLWDNLKLLAKNPQFKPLRAALAAWLIFTMVAGSTGVYSLFFAPQAHAADSWYNTDWLYRKKITLNNTTANLGVTAETLTDFPVLVKLDSGTDIDYTKTQDSGQDIRFTDSDGTTLLKYEIEKWDETGSSYVWVKVPSIDTTGNDYIYIYYDHSDVADAQDATNVWDSNYKAVYHLKETGNGTVGEYKDSTSNANNGQGGAGTSTKVPSLTSSGQIDGAQSFDGTDDYISTTTTNIGISGDASMTLDAWFNTSDLSTFRTVDVFGDQVALHNFSIYLNPSTTQGQVCAGFNGGNGLCTQANVYSANQWTHVTAVKTPGPINTTTTIYINGVAVTPASGASTSTPSINVTLHYIGAWSNNFLGPMIGNVDEIRISNTNRSADWIAASYKSGTDTFNTFSAEEAYNYAPNTPTNSLPANGAVNQILTPTLTALDFSDPDVGDTQAAAQWQITTTSGNYASTVFDSGTDTTNKTSITVSPALTAGTTYYWHVRYKDSSGFWSDYSTETSFRTSYAPNTPTNSAPTNGQMNQKLTLTLTSSAFSDSDEGATHSASQWLVRSLSDASYSSPIYDSGTDNTNKTSITIPTDTLEKNTTYFWKVRYKEDQNIWSSYSSETAFSTGVVPITVVSVGATEYISAETAKLTVQVTNADGTPINDATVTVSVYAPNNDVLLNAQAMTYLTASNGIYYRNYTTPDTAGVYIYSVTATSGTDSSYSSHTFHVSSALNTISTINTTVQSESTAQTSERNAQASERASQATERTAQATERTEQDASRTIVEDIQSDVHTANANLDILVGGLIVTQSAVNDASGTTTAFITDLTNATNDFYNNSVLTFTSGSLNGQVRRISDYNGTSKTITLDPALTSAPADDSTFTIVKQNVRVEEQAADIHTDVANVQTDVTYIRSKVDSIYTLLGTVDTNLSSAQTAVNSIRTSQQKAYKAKLSDTAEVATGNTYRAKLTLLDYEDNPVAAASTPTITIYNPTRIVKVDAQDMTADSTGIYSYSYTVPSDGTAGLWEATVTTAVGTQTNQQLNDYFNVTGSPAQVLINSVSTTIPTITAAAKITNEGSGDFEYHYEWCVVSSQDNQCGGNDDVYYSSASKLIQAGKDFDTNLTATVPTAGTYWFKMVVYYGTEASGASRQFTATAGTTTPSGSGGTYYPSQTVTVDTLNTEIKDMQKTISAQSTQLAKALDALGIIKPIILSGSKEQLDNIKQVQNKLADLQAVSSTIRQVVEQNGVAPVVETYMKFNSVDISFLITNPASTKQTVNFKSFLPAEVKTENIEDLDGLKVDYDTNANSYYVSGAITLGPKQSITKTIKIKDIWVFENSEIDSIKNQANSFNDAIKNTQYSAQAVLLKNNIDDLMSKIMASQKAGYTSPQDHILAYRDNKGRMQMAQNDLDKLKDLVVQAGASQGLVGKIGGIQTFATWGIVLAIIFGFLLMGVIIFSMWRYQVVLAAQLINSNKEVLHDIKRKKRK